MQNSHNAAKKLFAGFIICLAQACASTQNPEETQKPVPVTPSAPAYQLDDILGSSAESIDALLGAPALTRKEGGGEYRRYTLSQCSLIVILYADETNGNVASHVEATALNSDEEKPDLEACLAAG